MHRSCRVLVRLVGDVGSTDLVVYLKAVVPTLLSQASKTAPFRIASESCSFSLYWLLVAWRPARLGAACRAWESGLNRPGRALLASSLRSR
jgi:hypothetical protein